jgi:hypothetical protein
VAIEAPGGYSDEYKPLRWYAVFSAIFNALLAGFLAAFRRSGGELPDRVDTRDIVLIGTASHKLSRLVAKDKVTSFARSPFVRYEKDAGPSEVSEVPRGRGLRYAIGEMVGCPFCLGQWIAAALACGLLVAPRTTRFLASIFAAHALSDALNVVYAAGQEKL